MATPVMAVLEVLRISAQSFWSADLVFDELKLLKILFWALVTCAFIT